MRIFMNNDRGLIYVSVIFILLIILMLSASLMHMLISNSMAINSNNDNYRAGYIVESVLELKIEEIIELCDLIINNYMSDLQAYDMGYIVGIDGHILCCPPIFYNYIANSVSDIESLSESADNPFEEYEKEHHYKIIIKCDLDKNHIDIISVGEYRQARKFIKVRLELPAIIDEGMDEYGLHTTIISPAKVIQYYQTFEKIDFQ